MIQSAEETIDLYIAAWNTTASNDEIKAAFAKCWAANGKYIDPNYIVEGVEGISGLAIASLEKVPGRTFNIVVEPQAHHGTALYTWAGNIPGKAEFEGVDYIEFDDEGKIKRLVSFFPPL